MRLNAPSVQEDRSRMDDGYGNTTAPPAPVTVMSDRVLEFCNFFTLDIM